MKAKIKIYSNRELINFFSNLELYFDISIENYDNLRISNDQKNISVVFLDDETEIPKENIKKVYDNDNYIFVCKDFSVYQKFSLLKKNTLIYPVSINRLIDIVNEFVNKKKHLFSNTQLNNNSITNTQTNEKIYLTQAEYYILLKLFSETNIKKRALERDVLEIKHELNTSSIESHLNRIRKKLKKINSNFTISSKDKYVYFEILSQDN